MTERTGEPVLAALRSAVSESATRGYATVVVAREDLETLLAALTPSQPVPKPQLGDPGVASQWWQVHPSQPVPSGLRERIVQASIYLANGDIVKAHAELEAALAATTAPAPEEKG